MSKLQALSLRERDRERVEGRGAYNSLSPGGRGLGRGGIVLIALTQKADLQTLTELFVILLLISCHFDIEIMDMETSYLTREIANQIVSALEYMPVAAITGMRHTAGIERT